MFMDRINSESSVAISVRSPSPIPSEAQSPPHDLNISIRSSTPKRDLASDISTSSSLSSSNASLSSLPRSSKRSSSTSNDLIYERDRFRARLHTLNGSSCFSTEPEDAATCDQVCEVCDEVGRKTTKLMSERDTDESEKEIETGDEGEVEEGEEDGEEEVGEEESEAVDSESFGSTLTMSSGISPLDPQSSFYASLKPVDSSSLHLKHMSFSQVEQVFSWYFNRPLPPTDVMFPWLHGLHMDNFAQRQFFVYQQQQQQQQQQQNKQVQVSESHYASTSSNYQDISRKPEGSRFLMTINADHHIPKGGRGRSNSTDEYGDKSFAYSPVLKNSVSLSEILSPIDISRVEMVEMIESLVLKLFPEELGDDEKQELVNQFVSDCIKVNHLPTFLYLDPDTGVSLRNFHIQVSKSATFSDFVIYRYNTVTPTSEEKVCDDSKDSMSYSIARVLWLAQRNESFVNGLSATSPYNIFVANEIMDIKELVKSYNDLFTVKPSNTLPSAFHAASITAYRHTNHNISSAYTSTDDGENFHFDPSVLTSLAIWDGDYQVKERLETITMSSATKISKNVWIGNIWDCHIMMESLKHKTNNFYTELVASDYGHKYCSPDNSVIIKDLTKFSNPNEILNHLSKPRANWRLFVHCNDRANFPALSTLSNLLFQFSISPRINSDADSEEYHVIEFPPSGSVGLGNCKVENLMSIINLCKLLFLFSSSTSKAQGVMSSLIYCSDGFTESSLIVLCYLIYSDNIRLDQAMLKLHLDFGRPFYIFGSDVQILRKLEPLLRKFSPSNPSNKGNISWGELEVLSNEEINDFLLGSNAMNQSVRLGYIDNGDDDENENENEEEDEAGTSDEKDDVEIDEETNSDSDSSLVHSFIKKNISKPQSSLNQTSRWVEDVEGSLPSRILSYLYLGSLKHANNLTLMSRLGIQHIISAGEQLDWIHGYKFREVYDVEIEKINDGSIEIYRISKKEAPEKKKAKKNEYPCSITTVMKVNNLQDDGIDELSTSLPTVLAYINERYEEEKNGEGGKILVHCRVGVSRSATIVISEVMRRLNINLARAYLYVRVRRLNIVIQPNLRFMYELFKWEEKVKEDKRLVGDVEPEPEKLREIDWFVMCREIMRLNFPYLNS
ncbi:hypothetical protein CLIB1423_12S02806 [[Candida] railenensis]|uniref:Uncharacterized protein n=1 Tax=[Candida] railenensis TaxID=45579 RepID=A0A9P0QQR5_9ASCO|nr:hypothetical protein CLIB1423_12S02806 [[Candida] railenensis]